MTLRLLIAEDDPSIAQVVAFGAQMTWPGCQVAVVAEGMEALRRFAADRPDLVVLDVQIPPPDGFTVCRRIRETSSSVPILMLTVRTSTLDKVRALDLGADDYLTKPFDHLELLARLRALLPPDPARGGGRKHVPGGGRDGGRYHARHGHAHGMRARRGGTPDLHRVSSAGGVDAPRWPDTPPPVSAAAGLGTGVHR
jgi:DNA-binding response OmpR family regulator